MQQRTNLIRLVLESFYFSIASVIVVIFVLLLAHTTFHYTFERNNMGYSLAQVNDRNGLIAMCVIFSITSTTAVVLRFYARKVKGLRIQADDWLIAVSLVSACSEVHSACILLTKSSA